MGRREQMSRAYQAILEKRQLSFIEVRVTMKKPLADQPAQNAVAEEFQPLVIERSPLGNSTRRRGLVRALDRPRGAC